MLKISWHVAIFDEAHKLKNRNSKTYEACCRLPTKLRYGLTGTAMQVGLSTRSFILGGQSKPAVWLAKPGCAIPGAYLASLDGRQHGL